MFDFIKTLFKPKADLRKLVEEGAVIIDVRTRGEYQSGHIKGSKNMPLDTIKKETAVLKKLNKPLITVCRSGSRSGMAKSILSAAGVEVHNGGAWSSLENKFQ